MRRPRALSASKVHRPFATTAAFFRQRRRTEYTRKTIVETMPYTEVDVSEQQGAPVRTGVQHFEVSADEAGQRLDNFVHKRLGEVPRSKVYRVIRKGEVRVNGHRAGPDTRLAAHDKIRIPPVRMAEKGAPVRPPDEILNRLRDSIVHEDADFGKRLTLRTRCPIIRDEFTRGRGCRWQG